MDAEDTLTHPLPPLVKSASRNSIDEGVSWFHGKILRDEAERILSINGNSDGLFLVRESSSSLGDYVLSLVHNNEPIHYQIRRHGGDAFFSIDGGPIFHGLEMLISYYQEGGLGLSTKLGQICKGQPPPSDSRRHGRTNLLHRATKEGEVTVVRELVKSGYHNLDAKNQEGQTAVHLASIMGFDDILEVLLTVGANPNILDSNGLTPLHYAAQNNLPHTISVLLKYEANPQVRASGSGWVPLHYAADKGYFNVVKLLLSLNYPCHPRSNYNETPLDLALKNNHQECYNLLKNHQPVKPLYPRTEWFHENLDREGTLEHFRNNSFKDGSFLVRRSTRKQNFYVLSVVSNNNTFNYEIQNKDTFYFIDDGPYLESLDHVVDYYRRTPDGLPTNLVHAISPDVAMNNNNQTSQQAATIFSSEKNHVPGVVKPSEICGNNNTFDCQPSSTVSKLNLICRESLKLGCSVGEGEFGSVLQGKWINQANIEFDVAVKTLRDEQMQHCREEFIREVEVMVGLNHHCIVKLLGVCLGPPLMMVQELVAMGSLLDYILDYSTDITLQDMLIWSSQIAWGMTYLESKRFVHRDLAARNILLSSKTQVKISDFGLSRVLSSDREYYRASTGGRWPVKWYAPESINYGTFSHASDVWSYGIALWEIFTLGDLPYGDMTGNQVIQLIESNKRLEIPENCPNSIKSIIQQCWLYSPESRPTFKFLYNKFCSESEFCSISEYIK